MPQRGVKRSLEESKDGKTSSGDRNQEKILGELSFEIFRPRHRHLSIRNKS